MLGVRSAASSTRSASRWAPTKRARAQDPRRNDPPQTATMSPHARSIHACDFGLMQNSHQQPSMPKRMSLANGPYYALYANAPPVRYFALFCVMSC